LKMPKARPVEAKLGLRMQYRPAYADVVHRGQAGLSISRSRRSSKVATSIFGTPTPQRVMAEYNAHEC
jgi:hypothetical protein